MPNACYRFTRSRDVRVPIGGHFGKEIPSRKKGIWKWSPRSAHVVHGTYETSLVLIRLTGTTCLQTLCGCRPRVWVCNDIICMYIYMILCIYIHIRNIRIRIFVCAIFMRRHHTHAHAQSYISICTSLTCFLRRSE